MQYKHSIHSFMLCVLTVIALCAAQTVFAQTTVFAYQGKLDFGGVPANGNYDFQFKLFDAVSDGTQQGATLEQLNITVANGVYTVNLDFGAAVFTGADRFLEVNYRLTGSSTYTTLTPRQFVTSTPYSIRSLVATSADGLSATCTNCVTSNQIQNVQGSQVTGNVAGSQISGTIPVGSVPAGNINYIHNTTAQQASANFNISGNGTAAGTLSAGTLSGNVVSATTQYNINAQHVLSIPGSNTFVGSGPGASNTTGHSNAFFGIQAGFSNTTGDRNAFFGAAAGRNNTTGSLNTFYGFNAGYSNTTGFTNAFFGTGAGFSNTTGNDNSFFGKDAGYLNTSGTNNTFFGRSTGYNNTTGFQNAFFGTMAGIANTSGSSNSYFGESAGYFSTTGFNNSFFGNNAGYSNTTGANNAFFGREAGYSNTTGIQNTFIGISAGKLNTTGNFNTFFGRMAGNDNTTGSSNSFFGERADAASGNLQNAAAIGANAQVSTSNSLVLGSINGINGASATINVGIGTTSPDDRLHVNGIIRVSSLGAAGSTQLCRNAFNQISTCSSSLRYKSDLRPFSSGLAIINRLEPISFTWKEGGLRDVGFGAEAVEKVEPLFITYNAAGQVEGVKYDRITVALVNALKEQQQQLATQQMQIAGLNSTKAENAKLKAQLADILARLEHLEKIRVTQQ
jgi:trimeric autotransporter adhesin